jgi:hypothetical protein
MFFASRCTFIPRCAPAHSELPPPLPLPPAVSRACTATSCDRARHTSEREASHNPPPSSAFFLAEEEDVVAGGPWRGRRPHQADVRAVEGPEGEGAPPMGRVHGRRRGPGAPRGRAGARRVSARHPPFLTPPFFHPSRARSTPALRTRAPSRDAASTARRRCSATSSATRTPRSSWRTGSTVREHRERGVPSAPRDDGNRARAERHPAPLAAPPYPPCLSRVPRCADKLVIGSPTKDEWQTTGKKAVRPNKKRGGGGWSPTPTPLFPLLSRARRLSPPTPLTRSPPPPPLPFRPAGEGARRRCHLPRPARGALVPRPRLHPRRPL